MSLLGIFLGLGLLIFFAFRGRSLIWAAPICAALVAFLGGKDLLTSYTQDYMGGFVGFTQSWFPVFMLSAIFGKIMEVTGGAQSITRFVVEKLGRSRVILISVACGGLLAYGGISGFVIIFSMYPIVLGLFREADITRKLIPATIMTGAFQFAMSAIPGSPTIQNLIPAEHFGTKPTAAPILGMICAVFMFVGAVWWLERRAKILRDKGEGFTEPDEHVQSIPVEDLPNPLFSALPFIIILAMLNIFEYDIILCLLAGVGVAVLLNYKYLGMQIGEVFNEGIIGAISAVTNTSAAVGFGTVVRTVPGFKTLTDLVLNIKGSPLIAESIAINVLAGATGSASGGMAIALEALAENFIAMSQSSGIPLEVFHRVAAIASGGLNTLPHDGAVVTYLSYCGIKHRDGFFDIFITCGAIPIIANIIAIILGTMGVV